MAVSIGNVIKRKGLPWDLLVLVPLMAVFFAAAYLLRVRYDDAYIVYRYAQNLADGNGLVYNVGERVEGYTCVLWLLLLSALYKAGLDIVRMSAAFGIGFGWLTIIATSWLAYTVSGDEARWRRWLPSTLVAVCPFFIFNAGTGMETTLAACLVTAALGFVLSDRDRFCGPVLFGLASLARPDTVLYAGVAFLYDLKARRLKQALMRTLPVVILFGGQIAFRLLYYGDILPNTYYAKVGFSSNILLRGMRYTTRFINAWWYLPLLGLAVLALFPRRRLRYGLLVAAAVVHTAYVIRVGGDFMPCYRFFMPVLPVMLVLVAESIVGLTAVIKQVKLRTLCRLAPVALILVVMSGQLRTAVDARDRTLEFNIRKARAATYFLQNFPPDTLIATGAIGIVGYVTKMPILDILGKVDRHVAHADVGPIGRGFTGHEKYDADYIFERDPAVIFIPLSSKKRFVVLPAWRTIWEHPLLAERYEVVRDEVPYYRRKSVKPGAQARPADN